MKDFVKKSISNHLHCNIDVHKRRLNYEFPIDGVKYIEKLQAYFFNMTFSDKSRYDRFFLASNT